MKVLEFRMLVEEEMQVPVRSQRLWLWAGRQNQTVRPSRCLITGAPSYHAVIDHAVPWRLITHESSLHSLLEYNYSSF